MKYFTFPKRVIMLSYLVKNYNIKKKKRNNFVLKNSTINSNWRLYLRNITKLSYIRSRIEVSDNAIKKDTSALFRSIGDEISVKSIKLSEWSNWSYYVENENSKNDFSTLFFNQHFDFVPKRLRKYIKYKNNNLTKLISNHNPPGVGILDLPTITHNFEVKPRPCILSQGYCEFNFKTEYLSQIKIMNQINKQLIAGLIDLKNIKMVILIDQHAVHERIRYEYLLNKYKALESDKFLSIKLKTPLMIVLSSDECNLLHTNRMLLEKYGIKLNAKNDKTILIYEIPKCIVKYKFREPNEKLLLKMKNLLADVVENFINGRYTLSLPRTMHDAIAQEACHGAIKFGDKLSNEKCQELVRYLENTRCPTQCAHGRPSLIPVLDFSNFGDQHIPMKKKLNFAALRA